LPEKTLIISTKNKIQIEKNRILAVDLYFLKNNLAGIITIPNKFQPHYLKKKISEIDSDPSPLSQLDHYPKSQSLCDHPVLPFQFSVNKKYPAVIISFLKIGCISN
jgi:hypothetical protein